MEDYATKPRAWRQPCWNGYMHNIMFCFASVYMIALAICGYRLDSPSGISVIVLAVCLIGVPHGGLDHRAGRKLLFPGWGAYWILPFFGLYLSIAAMTVCGWMLSPVVTALLSFVVSASHFGQEDQLSGRRPTKWRMLFNIASGGLVIWIPAIARPSEMAQVLDAIIPGSIATAGSTIVTSTQLLATLFVPLALAEILYLLYSRTTRTQEVIALAIRQMVFIGLFALTPIPISFAMFFCGWHSIRGLQTLMLENKMTLGELTLATLPMSICAIALTGMGMWFWYSGREIGMELTRTLFLGLSGLAVPHLVLHAIPKRLFMERVRFESNFQGAA